jgi:hypothetical protein
VASITLTTPDNGSSPLFRSFNPSASPTRTFPRLSDILSNTATATLRAEPFHHRLPLFRCHVREVTALAETSALRALSALTALTRLSAALAVLTLSSALRLLAALPGLCGTLRALLRTGALASRPRTRRSSAIARGAVGIVNASTCGATAGSRRRWRQTERGVDLRVRAKTQRLVRDAHDVVCRRDDVRRFAVRLGQRQVLVGTVIHTG